MNIYDKFTAENVVYLWENDKNRPPYIGDLLFENKRVRGLKISYLKGKRGLPVALVPANYNTNVLYRDRIPLEGLSFSLPFFKEAYAIDEETRQDLMSIKEEYAKEIIEKVFDDQLELLIGADVSAEIMKMQLIYQGTIAIEANGVKSDYDYGFDSSTQMKTLSKLWSADGATPVKDFSAQIQAYRELHNQTDPKYAIMGTKVYRKLADDPIIKEVFAKSLTPEYFPSKEQIKNYLEKTFGVTILINDKQYIKARDTSNTPVNFYPEDRFTLLSTLDLGKCYYGTTPEEADLLAKSSKADSVSVTSKGVTVTTWREVDPVNVNTKVSEVVAPSCPNIDTIYIVKCL